MLLQNLFGCSFLLDFSSAVHSSAPPGWVEKFSIGKRLMG